jgi:hypothetical protein
MLKFLNYSTLIILHPSALRQRRSVCFFWSEATSQKSDGGNFLHCEGGRDFGLARVRTNVAECSVEREKRCDEHR